MLRLKILSVGKTKERWLDEAFQEYVNRLKTSVRVECLWARDSEQLLEWAQKEPLMICLDPDGRQLTSEEFSSFIAQRWEKGGSRLTFVIGGAEGLPLELKKDETTLISLSPLTFTHQLTRLILIEQIYRAIEIQKGSPYHK